MEKPELIKLYRFLKSWCAVEILSPKPFCKSLFSEPRYSGAIAIQNNFIPWDNNTENARFPEPLLYQIILGNMHVGECITTLLEKYNLPEQEETVCEGEFPLAIITVDRQGRLLDRGGSIAISSFAWGFPRALSGHIMELAAWPEVEAGIQSDLRAIIQSHRDCVIDYEILSRVLDYLVRIFDFPADVVTNTKYAMPFLGAGKEINLPDADLLNSPRIKNIHTALGFLGKDFSEGGEFPENITAYMKAISPAAFGLDGHTKSLSRMRSSQTSRCSGLAGQVGYGSEVFPNWPDNPDLMKFGMEETFLSKPFVRAEGNFLREIVTRLLFHASSDSGYLQDGKDVVDATGAKPNPGAFSFKEQHSQKDQVSKRPVCSEKAGYKLKDEKTVQTKQKCPIHQNSGGTMDKPCLVEASKILSAWIALEVLSPQTFRKPENLCGGDKNSIIMLENLMPWDKGFQKRPPHTQLFYHIILGSIRVESALSALVEKYGDSNDIWTATQGETPIAVITVDQHGCLCNEDSAIVVSSFAWGLPKALAGNLTELADWAFLERKIASELRQVIQNKGTPVNRPVLDEIFQYLTHTLDLSGEMVVGKNFAVRIFHSAKKKDPPQSLLLNSFYVGDLVVARDLVENGKAPENLLRYLGALKPSERRNILQDHTVLKEVLSPEKIPVARWPGAGRQSLALLQQAAVNQASAALEKSGILAVNGPPGTGKTTLLRDIVADIISQRASALACFDDPEQAFIESGHKIKSGHSSLKIYQLDKSIKGFEILVASSNNKAVENISAELPDITSVSGDVPGLRYFASLSDHIAGGQTWGLISAVLGNSSNCASFRQKFWADRDYGMSVYLAAATGVTQTFDIREPEGNRIIESRPPLIVTADNPPSNRAEALERWKKARDHFLEVERKSRDRLREIHVIKKLVYEIEDSGILLKPGECPDDLLHKHLKTKPGFFWRILGMPSARAWKREQKKLLEYCSKNRKLMDIPDDIKACFVDNALFSKKHHDIHLCVPWCDAHTQALRDDVFVASMELHKAFIDAAASPLRHNLGVFMDDFGKGAMLEKKDRNLVSDLWSSLFLVVPCMSTTFASAARMLENIPPNSLGWLLLDEAGQALPQAAVGAIMRTQRAVVTGDPMQIEPVVMLPEHLTLGICKQFGIDDSFNAPRASAQTLADSATNLFAEFHTRYGSRSVGMPLLVHRRCADPMFSISNAVAYERLMVHSKNPGYSSVRDCLGPSVWFDIRGRTYGKWCPEEGEKVLDILEKLADSCVDPDLYIVTPFTDVANQLRKIVRESNILESWDGIDPYAWVNERIGTVHTVQGREAQAVILVLGASGVDQAGARIWAGKTPNILNVAVTRAREVFYVAGNADLWKNAGVFRDLYERLDIHSEARRTPDDIFCHRK